ncbi:G-protein coupled receptor family C group 6 member A-like [Engraulis encrasicolus]|uniref:G-protein coupled receptor family C group 6 member A-like n=1 Tax=Engraulis encrasicolus TaxID=184585 RepID=UPI002FCF371A
MAVQDGDIIIGGLFPVHESVDLQDGSNGEPSKRGCTRYNVARMLQALMLIEAVETINNSPLLGNLTLGYHILDSCSDVTTALAVTQRFLDVHGSTFSLQEGNRTGWSSSTPSTPVDVLVGGYHSEISIAVARHLSIRHIPQISYGATTGILSDKSRFPSFMRTVPEDTYQTQAIVDVLEAHDWTWVGVVTTDDDYGRYASQRFHEHAQRRGICTAFTVVLPPGPELAAAIRSVVRHLEDDQRVGAMVSFAKPGHMMRIAWELTPNATGRVWIAGDSWATSERMLEAVTLSDLGVVLGVTLRSARRMTGFDRYLEGLNPGLDAHQHNTILQEYLRGQPGGDATQPQLGEALKRRAQPSAVLSVGLAVSAAAQAVANLCANRDCRDGKHFEPWEGNIVSKCAESCPVGYRRLPQRGQPMCCYECTRCPKNTFSNETDAHECLKCGVDQWSDVGSCACTDKTVLFFDWSEPLAVVLLCWAALAMVLTLLVLLVFLDRWNTPVVKASVRPISVLLLLSLLGKFASVVLFVGRPTDVQCQARQVLFGLSFTLCASCVLAKSLKIVLAFQLGPTMKRVVAKLYQPYLIVVVGVSVQVAICSTWLLLGPPHATLVARGDRELVLQCSEGRVLFFGVMLGYVGLIGVLCFLIAFKGRKLPDNYNEAKFISFSMLVYLICWAVFGPVYAAQAGVSDGGGNWGGNGTGSGTGASVLLPGVEMTVILMSSCAVLFCHFIPKCYVILFRSRCNTREVFSRKLWEFVRHNSEAGGDDDDNNPSKGFHNVSRSASLDSGFEGGGPPSTSSTTRSQSISSATTNDNDRPSGFHHVPRSGSLDSTLSGFDGEPPQSSGSELDLEESISVPIITDDNDQPKRFHSHSVSHSGSLDSTFSVA